MEEGRGGGIEGGAGGGFDGFLSLPSAVLVMIGLGPLEAEAAVAFRVDKVRVDAEERAMLRVELPHQDPTLMLWGGASGVGLKIVRAYVKMVKKVKKMNHPFSPFDDPELLVLDKWGHIEATRPLQLLIKMVVENVEVWEHFLDVPVPPGLLVYICEGRLRARACVALVGVVLGPLSDLS